MSSEHNGNSYVTWRDLWATLSEHVSKREIDQRLRDLDRETRKLADTSERALLLAREGVLKHDEESNAFRKQIETERIEYARNEDVARELEKLKLELINKIDADIASTRSEVATIRATQSSTGKDVKELENEANILKGRNIAKLSAAVAIIVAIMSFVAPAVRELIFGG